MILSGHIVNVATRNLGSVLVTASGNLLTITDAADFAPTGWVVHRDVVYSYEAVNDTDTWDTILLDSPVGAWAADEPVEVYPLSPVKQAEVLMPEGGDPVVCTIPHHLQAMIAEGSRDTEAESVEIEELNGEWYIRQVLGMETIFDGSKVDVGGVPLTDEIAQTAEMIEADRLALEAAKVELQGDMDALDDSLTAAKTALEAADASITQAVTAAAADADQALLDASAASGLASSATIAAQNANNAAVAAWDRAMASVESGNSLILNGGFEKLASGTTDTAAGWDRNSTGFRVTTGQRSGAAAFQALPGATARTYWANDGAYMPSSTGRKYYVEGWVNRTAGTTTANVGFIATVRTAAGGFSSFYVTAVSDTLGTGAYVKVSGIFNITTANTEAVRFGLRIDGSANTYLYEDVIVVDVTEAETARLAAVAAATAASTADGKAVDAQGTATSALTSANGKNARISSLAAANETATPPTTNPDTGLPLIKGDTWWQLDSLTTRNVIGQWDWDGSRWKRSALSDAVLASLDLNKLVVSGSARMLQAVVDKIIGDAAFFNVITANRVVIGSGSNLFPDPMFQKPSAWNSPTWIRPTVPGKSGTGGTMLIPASVAQVGAYVNLATTLGPGAWMLPVHPGAKYRIGAWFKPATDAPIGSLVVFCRVYGETGAGTNAWASPSSRTNSAIAPAGVWTWVGGEFTVPDAGAMFAAPGFYAQATITSEVEVSNPEARPMAVGELIVDGSIYARALFADEALASKFVGLMADFQTVFANKITASMVNFDQAFIQQLATQVGTFQELFAGKFTGEAIRGGTIEGVDYYSPSQLEFPQVHLGQGLIEVNRGEGQPTVTIGGPTTDRMQMTTPLGVVIAGFDEQGNGAAKSMDIRETLTVAGDDVLAMFDQRALGVVCRQRLGTSSALNGLRFGFNSELGLLELGVTMYAGRLYRVVFEGMINSSQQAEIALRWRRTYSSSGNPLPPTITSLQQNQANYLLKAGLNEVRFQSFIRPTNTEYQRILLTGTCLTSSGQWAHISSGDTYPADIYIEDVGTYGGQGDGTVNTGNGTPYQGTAVPPSSTAPPQSYVSTWNADWIKSWRGATAVTDALQQGYYSPSQRYSMIHFPPQVQAALAGSSISKIEVYLENLSWYYGAGGKAKIGRHNVGTTAPGTPQTTGGSAFDSPQWTAGTSKWVTLPADWYSRFALGTASGGATGITLGEGAGSDMTYYGKFRYATGSVKLRAYYSK